MPERWVNAKATITVPLDVGIDASPGEKAEAAFRRLDPLLDLIDDQDAVITLGFEDVEDGEPIPQHPDQEKSG